MYKACRSAVSFFQIFVVLFRHKSTFPGFKELDPTFATRAIHAHQDPEQWQDGKPVVVPISLATTFKQEAPAEFVVSAFLFVLQSAHLLYNLIY